MPGDNCSVYGCGSCRRHKDIRIFKLPREAVDKGWRDLWLGEIKKTRTVDKKFQEQIDKNNVFTCKKHFKEEDIIVCKYDDLFFSIQ